MSAKKSATSGRGKARHKSILVVDDEPGTVEVLLAVLSEAGYDAEGAAHGRDALAKLRRGTFDLVLLDFVMPALDGAEVLADLRKSDALKNLAVIMMSGIPESMVKRRSKGYHVFLRKPFSLDELLDAVTKLIER